MIKDDQRKRQKPRKTEERKEKEMRKRSLVFIVVAMCLSFQFVRSYAGVFLPEEAALTRYEMLEAFFRGEVTRVTVNFHERRNSQESYFYRQYFFEIEVETGGEVAMEFSNIASAKYSVYVNAYNEKGELLFSGSTRIEVTGAMTEAEVVLEIVPGIEVRAQLSVDLGEENIESVEVRIIFLGPDGLEIQRRTQNVPYVAPEKSVAIWTLFAPLNTSMIELYLPRYDIGTVWEVDWENRGNVSFSLPDPPPYTVALEARFLSEREEGRVWVVPIDFATIQEAIDASSLGDLIRVLPSTHYGPIVLKPGVEIHGSAVQILSNYWEDSFGPLVYGKGDGQAWAKIKGVQINQYRPRRSEPVILLEGLSLTLEKCLVLGQKDQPLIRAFHSSVRVENCTLSGGNSGLEIAYSHESKIVKSLLLDMRYPILLMGASVALDQTSIFWNCDNVPEGARVEDPMLGLYFWPLEGSPCRKEEIGVYY